jgi:hypothetical protein
VSRFFLLQPEVELAAAVEDRATAKVSVKEEDSSESGELCGGGSRERERERECGHAHGENGWCVRLLYFWVVREWRPRMGTLYGYSIGDSFYLLHSVVLDSILRFRVSIGDSLMNETRW